MKRALDIAICLLAAPLLMAVGAVIALCVLLDSPGPVLYRSRRVGRGGRVFSMLKFRTMRHGVGGPPLSVFDDERYTPLGRALAASRLDELPQVVNVLRGDMRLVGPRPELPEFVDANAESYAVILTAPPGLTGPAQLRFAGGEGRLLASRADRVAAYRTAILPEKVTIDLDYVRRASLRTDVSLLCLTLLLPARLGTHAYRAWRATRAARPAGTTVALLAASLAVTCVFAVELAAGF